MLLGREAESNLLKLQGILNKYYTEKVEIDYEKQLAQTGIFSLFYLNQGALSIIFDIKNCKIVDISKNVTNFTGCNRKEFDTDIIFKFVSLLAP